MKPDHILNHGLSWRRVNYSIPCGADTRRGVRCRNPIRWICACGLARCHFHADAKLLRQSLPRLLAKMRLEYAAASAVRAHQRRKERAR